MRYIAPPVLGSIEAVNGFFPQDFRHFFAGGFLLAAQEQGGVAVADYGIGVVLIDCL